jgi:hypothetical protein
LKKFIEAEAVLNFTIYTQEHFPVALKWQALAFMRVQWPSIFAGRREFSTDTYPPELGPIHFVASEGELLVTHAAIIRFDLEHAGSIYKTYGYGNMFTFPAFREKGVGGHVLEMATNYIQRSDIDIAILFCDSKRESFYAKRGWEITRSPTRVGVPSLYKNLDLVRGMLFVSEKGRQGRNSFNEVPVYVVQPW